MTSIRKHSLIETNSLNEEPLPQQEKRSRRSSLVNTPWMNKIKPFIYGAKNDDVPDCYNRVRYIRDSCKVLSDLWKNDKDFLNKSVDGDISKSFKEFRSSEIARNYRSPSGSNGNPSILNKTIDDFIQIHDLIDLKRKESFEQFKRIVEQAKDKHINIRQTMTELRDNYEKAQRKLETADANLKKFQTRSDRLTLANFDERCRELEDIRSECEQARTLSRDIYTTEIYRISSEEHSLTYELFYQYLNEEFLFFNSISKYYSTKIPEIEQRFETDPMRPILRCDLTKHCSKRADLIAYPIDICIHLLKNHFREEGIFRIASSQIKQKKFLAELDLQSIDKSMNLNELGYDPHVPASALKQYLRELPDCLLTSNLINQWNEIPSINSEQGRVQRISQLINQLPKVNYENLCYLVRFLSSIAEYSHENKMTASNLGICIGCSLLFPKDQINNSSMSNSYASASIILELMIIHHKQLFPSSNSSIDQQTVKSIKSQPDLIPTEFHSKSRSGSNENLLESPTINLYPPLSPGTRRKAKAPPPPPPSASALPGQPTDKDDENAEMMSGEDHLTVSNSSSFNPNDKVHRRTPSGGNQLDRPGAPPPHPPSAFLTSSPLNLSKQRQSLPLSAYHHEENSSPIDDDKTSSHDIPTESNQSITPTNENVNVGKLISELNNRMAAARINSNNSQGNSSQINNIRASIIRNSNTNQNSPGETTDF